MTQRTHKAQAAKLVTAELLEAYKTWLDMELRFLCWEMAELPAIAARYRHMPGTETTAGMAKVIGSYLSFVGGSGSYHSPRCAPPSERAAFVLSAVGCDWRDGDDNLEDR